MSDAVLHALFVLTGLMLIAALTKLLPRAAHPAARAIVHAVMGLAALLIGNTAGAPFGAGIGLNALTLPVSAGLGVPGAALLWALRYFL